MTQPKDFLENELNVGDRVAFIDQHYRSLRHGKILKLNEKQATIQDVEAQGKFDGKYDSRMGYGKTCRYYNCIVKEAQDEPVI